MPKIQPRVLPFQKKEEVTPSALALHQHTIRRLRAEIKKLHSRINKLERDREVITRAAEYYQTRPPIKWWQRLF
jgi:hypothetical protein